MFIFILFVYLSIYYIYLLIIILIVFISYVQVVDILRTTELYSSHLKTDNLRCEDPVTSDLIGALITVSIQFYFKMSNYKCYLLMRQETVNI